jgi:tripartite-type tricarboxylate transporter receptor subunit TctC
MRSVRYGICLLAFGAATLVFTPVSSLAQTWPQRTVKIIVPLPPGSGTDIAARLFADRLSARWSQPVVVENRQGGDGIPAVTAFLAGATTTPCCFRSVA